MSVTRPRPTVPEKLPQLLHDLSYAVIKNNPNDVIGFAADYFQQLLNERQKQDEELVEKDLIDEIQTGGNEEIVDGEKEAGTGEDSGKQIGENLPDEEGKEEMVDKKKETENEEVISKEQIGENLPDGKEETDDEDKESEEEERKEKMVDKEKETGTGEVISQEQIGENFPEEKEKEEMVDKEKETGNGEVISQKQIGENLPEEGEETDNEDMETEEIMVREVESEENPD